MRARAGRRANTQPVTDNVIARARSADTQQITTKYISLQILHVSSLISIDGFNTDDHRQCR